MPLPSSSAIARILLALLLLAGLDSCSVYNSIFHPYRLPTPEPSPEFKKQQKAKDLKAKKGSKADKKAKGEAAPTEEAAPVDTPSADDATAATEKKEPAKTKKVKYDRQGLMKKPKLKRRRYNKQPGKGFHPIQGIKNFFKYSLHGKPKQKPSGKGKDKSGAEPAQEGGDFPPETK